MVKMVLNVDGKERQTSMGVPYIIVFYVEMVIFALVERKLTNESCIM